MARTVPHRMKPGRFLALVAVLVLFAMALGATAVYLSASETRNTCKKVNLVQSEIRSTIARQKKSLPVNTYYRTHPTELARALVEINRELTVFNPLKC